MRRNLPKFITDEVRKYVIEGQLAPGQRINEVHLASALGCSRTPLREALTRLVGETFIESRRNLGFFVRPLSADEFEQLYSIRNRLDPWALEEAGIPAPEKLTGLRQLNRDIEMAASEPLEVIELDDQWHLELLAGCKNDVLLDLIRQMMLRTRRYEYVYFSNRDNVQAAVAEHHRILDALEGADLAAAVDALRGNMTTAKEPLRAWIEEQSS